MNEVLYFRKWLFLLIVDGQYITIWNKCIGRFREMTMEFGAEEIADDNNSFISSVERDISARLTDQIL